MFGGMYEPHLADSGGLVSRNFDELVMLGSAGRENLREPVGGAAQTTCIELLTVGNDKNVWLYHRVHIVVRLSGFR